MSELHFTILPSPQRRLWDVLAERASTLRDGGYYLAGGTALALQLGHRRSVDFDFFSQRIGIAGETESWLREVPGYVTRDLEQSTLHAEIASVKLSFIGAYRYPLLGEPRDEQGLRLAGILDIGLMKLLAITHRATLRDYIDLAAILRSGCTLADLLAASTRKYGSTFNPMVPLRALATFDDLEPEMPEMIDEDLASSWQGILREAVRIAGTNAL